MKNFVQTGEVLSVPAPYALLSGQGALVGTLFGVAGFDAALAAPVELHTRGVFEIAKAPSQAWTVGAAIYWDNATRVCTTTVGSNTLIGKATLVVAGGAGDVIGTVRLNA